MTLITPNDRQRQRIRAAVAIISLALVVVPAWHGWIGSNQGGDYLPLLVTFCLLLVVALTGRNGGRLTRATIAVLLLARVALVVGLTAWMLATALPLAREMGRDLAFVQEHANAPALYVVAEELLVVTVESLVEVALLLLTLVVVFTGGRRTTPMDESANRPMEAGVKTYDL